MESTVAAVILKKVILESRETFDYVGVSSFMVLRGGEGSNLKLANKYEQITCLTPTSFLHTSQPADCVDADHLYNGI